MNRVPVLVLTGIAVFLAVSLCSYSSADPPDSLVFPVAEGYENWCGKWGAYTASILFNSLGKTAYLLFVPFIALIYHQWHGKPVNQLFLRLVGFVLIFAAASGLICLNESGPWHDGPTIGPGGFLGVTCVYSLNSYFSHAGMTIIFVSTLIGGLVLACDYLIIRIFLWLFGLRPFNLPAEDDSTAQRDRLPRVKPGRSVQTLNPVRNRNAEIDEPGDEDEDEPWYPGETPDTIDESEDGEEYYDEDDADSNGEEYEDDYTEEDVEEEFAEDEQIEKTALQPAKPSKGLISWLKTKRPKDEPAEEQHKSNANPSGDPTTNDESEEYHLPSVRLLIESEKHDYDQQTQIARRQAKQLEAAFADFGLNIKVVDIQCGPVIAQYEVELERGLRLNKLTNLTDDLAIALRVPTVRIVAPIPGKNTVGVEVPNETRQLVRLREVIDATPEKLKSKMAIPIFLGQDVAGAPMVIDLAQMPHLLIAGRTGTGKSVCLNSIIVSILMTRTPDECRMIMIDPKMVELGQYESIPHLMHPVVTDMKKAEAILAWAVDKMEQRLQILSRARVRQLSEYNALSEEELYRRVNPESDEEWDETPRSMPYMVIVADEMADLMLMAAKDVETHIIRLAAKSRAVGIHLVLATQKPTVDIITGLIKSNLPARIAFTVATRVDSIVILDCIGAEKLLGHGDLLFLKPGTSQVLRGQGTYVSDPEINKIIADIAIDSPDYVIELVELQTGDELPEGGLTDPRDVLYNQAVEYIIREGMRNGKGKASISWLQRKMKVGYQRSARIFDYMEEDGIVGPGQGQQPRDILISMQEWRNRLAELENTLNISKPVDKPTPKPKEQPEQRPKPYDITDNTSPERLPFDGQQNRQHDGHKSGRSSQPNIRLKPGAKGRVEPGVGPIEDIDDSMLVEIRPNSRQRPKPPGRKGSDQRVVNRRAMDYDDDDSDEEGYVIEYEPDAHTDDDVAGEQYDGQYEYEDDPNVFGVVPVGDGDVPYDADDGEWEYEYEYVYEEVDAGEEEYNDPIDPKARYVEEMNVEAGGDWESEEDWDDDETDDDEPDHEDDFD